MRMQERADMWKKVLENFEEFFNKEMPIQGDFYHIYGICVLLKVLHLKGKITGFEKTAMLADLILYGKGQGMKINEEYFWEYKNPAPRLNYINLQITRYENGV